MVVYAVTYLSSIDEISVSIDLFRSKEEAREYINNEIETLQEDYENWIVEDTNPNKKIIRSWDYSFFVELTITEHDI